MSSAVWGPPCPSQTGFSTDTDAEPVTSVQQPHDGNAVLVSTLDSTIRLMDKGNCKLLQSYRGHTNAEYRIRSCLGLGDAVVISGSEDGCIYAWDVLEGKVIQTLQAHNGKVASAVAFNPARKEWASGGVDCKWRVRWNRRYADDVQVLSACGVCHDIRRVCREGGRVGKEVHQWQAEQWESHHHQHLLIANR